MDILRRKKTREKLANLAGISRQNDVDATSSCRTDVTTISLQTLCACLVDEKLLYRDFKRAIFFKRKRCLDARKKFYGKRSCK